MLKQNDSALLEIMSPASQELWALSIDFAAGYRHLNIMCFYEKLLAEYASGLVKVEVSRAPVCLIFLKSKPRLSTNIRRYVKAVT